MKIFKVGDCDWVAAESASDAFEHFKAEMEMSDEELTVEECVELTEEQMNTETIVDDDTAAKFGIKIAKIEAVSFRKDLDELIAKGTKFPLHLCSTEW